MFAFSLKDGNCGHCRIAAAFIFKYEERDRNLSILFRPPVGQSALGGFGDPEVDNLRHRLGIVDGYQNVRGFKVPMNYPFLVGVLDSQANLSEQLQTLAGGKLIFIAILYNQITRRIADQRGTDGIELARLLALVHVAMAEAGLAVWESKYFYDFWRPITGIRESDVSTGPTDLGDGNAATVGDPTFSPLGAPPRHR